MAIIQGTGGPDELTGTRDADTIRARGGDDAVDGRSGGDTLLGGAGDDEIDGGTGADIALGGGGDDDLDGGLGDDDLRGERGTDVLDGLEGNDLLDGGEGDDSLDGFFGSDRLLGGAGNDILDGGDDSDVVGRDELHGGAGDDELFGRAGNDVLRGDAGRDFLDGEAGDDLLDGGPGRDTLVPGAGDDVVGLDGGSPDRVFFAFYGNDTTVIGDDVVQGLASDPGHTLRFDLLGTRPDGSEGFADTRDFLDSNDDGRITGADAEVSRVGDDLVLDIDAVYTRAFGAGAYGVQEVTLEGAGAGFAAARIVSSGDSGEFPEPAGADEQSPGLAASPAEVQAGGTDLPASDNVMADQIL